MPLNAQALNTATFAELLADTHRTAVHLEMRDVYAFGDEAEDFETGASSFVWIGRSLAGVCR